MPAPARYTFDLDFKPQPARTAAAKVASVDPAAQPAPPPVPEVPKIELAEHQRLLAEAEANARAEAYEAGQADGTAMAVRMLVDEVARLVDLGRMLQQRQEADRLAAEVRAVELALTVARKLARRLVEAEPLGEIVALVRECLGPLRKAPHLVIRMTETDAEAIRPEVERYARESGYEGRLIVLGDPDIRRGDCRIDWADGGIVRDTRALEAEIEAAVERYVTTRGRPQGALHTDPVRPKPDPEL